MVWEGKKWRRFIKRSNKFVSLAEFTTSVKACPESPISSTSEGRVRVSLHMSCNPETIATVFTDHSP